FFVAVQIENRPAAAGTGVQLQFGDSFDGIAGVALITCHEDTPFNLAIPSGLAPFENGGCPGRGAAPLARLSFSDCPSARAGGGPGNRKSKARGSGAPAAQAGSSSEKS